MIKTKTISDTETRIFLEDGTEIILVGTAHISRNSVDEVINIIEQENPDRVCLELDKSRFESKTKKQDYSSMNLRKVFKEGKAFLVMANTALASFQKKMGQKTGVSPGEEILSAGKIAQEKGIPISLCDRDISVTLKRAWRISNLWNKCKLLATLLSSSFDKEEISSEDLEKMKESDTLQEMMKELAKELPGAKKALIDERDRYLATSILEAPGKKKIAVVGAGHAKGIISTMEKIDANELSKDLSSISTTPPPSKLGKFVGWLIPILILGLIVYSGITNGWDQGLQTFLTWVIVNAGFCALFGLIANCHPLNLLVAAVSSPIAALNPVLGVGIFTGIAESELRKPTVKDFENIAEDASKIKGWYKNRFLHAFLVFFMTSIGSIVGTFIGFPIIMNLLR